MKNNAFTTPIYGVFYAPVFSDAHMCLCRLREHFVMCQQNVCNVAKAHETLKKIKQSLVYAATL